MITDAKRAELRKARGMRKHARRSKLEAARLAHTDLANRGCGWNHWAHSHALDDCTKTRPPGTRIAKRPKRKPHSTGPKWTPLKNWLSEVDCNSEYERGTPIRTIRRAPAPERQGYSYNDAVQHGIVVES